MDKKFKLSDQPQKVKIIYASVIAVLCVTAMVIGIFSSLDKNEGMLDENPTVNLPVDSETNNQSPSETEKEENKEPDKLTFVSPVVGNITKGHSIDTPVFSDTLNEWRVHTGIDISADEGSNVYTSAKGVVIRVYNDPFLGNTVEVSHEGGIVSVYSNLSPTDIKVKEGDNVKSGALIGKVGDSSLSELADESHLHFAIKVNGVSVNPLDYISEDSKKASLGITEV